MTKPFTLVLSSSRVISLTNDDNTRTFFAFPCCGGEQQSYKKLVDRVSDVGEKFQLERYYDDPIAHVSVASCPGVVELQKKKGRDRVDSSDSDDIDDEESGIFNVTIDKIECTLGGGKTGKRFAIKLM